MKHSLIVAALIGAVALPWPWPDTGSFGGSRSSYQQEGGSCYSNEFGTRSADGRLYCNRSTGLWTRRR
ncbi:hypothetical protein [Gordonia sp. (in: high G+C Gram-positive bacteria)]|uniref:hypothetical protein n=1 Tax=Gordonia sp. (in: high G+C Gram-positive bacteria) TaxID=84139 RepID=UPI0039E4EBD8